MIYKFNITLINMHIPVIYELSHYIMGILSVKYNFIIILFLTYQFLQLYFDTRFFILNVDIKNLSIKNCFKKGNNINHTIKKLKQFMIGIIIGIGINYLQIKMPRK